MEEISSSKAYLGHPFSISLSSKCLPKFQNFIMLMWAFVLVLNICFSNNLWVHVNGLFVPFAQELDWFIMILKVLKCSHFHGLIDGHDIKSFVIFIILDKLQKINRTSFKWVKTWKRTLCFHTRWVIVFKIKKRKKTYFYLMCLE